jgi:hypothetical protein
MVRLFPAVDMHRRARRNALTSLQSLRRRQADGVEAQLAVEAAEPGLIDAPVDAPVDPA